MRATAPPIPSPTHRPLKNLPPMGLLQSAGAFSRQSFRNLRPRPGRVARAHLIGGRAALPRRLGRFAGGRDIFGTVGLKDALGGLDLLGSVAVHREENATLAEAIFVALGIVLGDAHADEGARKSADRAPHTYARKGRHDGTCGDQRANTRDR